MLHLIFLLLATHSLASTTNIFEGEARENGTLVYTEKHKVTLDDSGRPLEATTEYVSAEGKTLGTLHSDFRTSLNLPDHSFLDERTHARYGIRRVDGKPQMFNQDKDAKEETKTLDTEEDQGRLQVGCQGFNYYLYGKVDQIKEKRLLPVLFMIPGELSTYRFLLEYMGEDANQIVTFKVKIENWFLRIFAPKLEFRYDRKINRIVWYRGPSNIKKEKGKLRDVEITYKY